MDEERRRPVGGCSRLMGIYAIATAAAILVAAASLAILALFVLGGGRPAAPETINADGSTTLPVEVLDAEGAPYAGEVTVTVERRTVDADGVPSDSVAAETRTFASAPGANRVVFVLGPPLPVFAPARPALPLALTITASAPVETVTGRRPDGSECEYRVSRRGVGAASATLRPGAILATYVVRVVTEPPADEPFAEPCRAGG